MSLDLGNIRMYMGPRELGAPDDLETVIINFINGAKKELCIAVQELESKPIAESIIAARVRGVRVRLIIEGDYLTEVKGLADPWVAGGENEANRIIYGAILRAKVQVITDLNPAFFHQKYIVRDPDEDSTAGLLTGSTNFTPTCCHNNLNHVVVFGGKRMAVLYLREFEETWSGTFGALRERKDEPPRIYEVSGVKVKTVFAPDHSPEMEIMKQMLKAAKRVDFAMFTFAQSSGIDDAMICLNRAGIPVRGVLDRMQGNQSWAASRPVMNAGASLYWPKKDSGVRKVHHKLSVIDETIVIAGSFNFTDPANTLNDENVIIIGDMEETDSAVREKQKKIGAYALAEIDRMIGTLCEKMH